MIEDKEESERARSTHILESAEGRTNEDRGRKRARGTHSLERDK
jgi:hypothetical protein